MNYRTQFSPISSTRESHIDLPSREPREVPFSNSENTKFFRSWLVYDSRAEGQGTHRRINWSRALGLALAVGVSVLFWIGVAWLVVRLWK